MDCLAAKVHETLKSQEPRATARDLASAAVSLAVYYAQDIKPAFSREEFLQAMGEAWDYGETLEHTP